MTVGGRGIGAGNWREKLKAVWRLGVLKLGVVHAVRIDLVVRDFSLTFLVNEYVSCSTAEQRQVSTASILAL